MNETKNNYVANPPHFENSATRYAYLPEGQLLTTQRNRELTSTLAGIERAIKTVNFKAVILFYSYAFERKH